MRGVTIIRRQLISVALTLLIASPVFAQQTGVPAQPEAPPPTIGQGMPEVLAQGAPLDNAIPAEPAIVPIEPASATEEIVPSERSVDLPHDLSPWGMFMAADYVVKGVMIGLAIASVVTWTVWLAKTLEIFGARRRLRKTLRTLHGAASLASANEALTHRRGVAVILVRAAAEEVARSEAAIDHISGDGLKERVNSRLVRLEVAAGRRLTTGTGILATIGSISPFVGLFGTVWGIMNAFIGISQAQSSSLAVVAPGIAEALLATAMGLVAAIPAVIFYNAFARSITGYRQLLADAAAAIERLVSRDLDHRSAALQTSYGMAAE